MDQFDRENTIAGICGDWHGDPNFGNGVLHALHARGVRQVLHCGDFGFGWDPYFIPSIDKVLKKFGMRLRWVPGNHENYDTIDQLMEHDAQWITDRIYVLDRGEQFQIGLTKFAAIGGAHSIDKSMRKAHVSWWPQELLTYGDVMRILETPQVHVVLSHDAPWSCDLKLDNGYKDDPETKGNRELLQVAVDHLRPTFLFHGHYHQRLRTQDSNGVQCYGLADNFTPLRRKNYLIYDTVDRAVLHDG